VLRAAHLHGVRVVVSVLSTCVFPEKLQLPMTEADLHAGPAAAAHEGYAVAKRGVETLSRLYSQQHGHEYMMIIPTNIYGTHDNFDLEAGHVLPSLIRRCYDARLARTPFTVRGSGVARRQFIESRDLARIILLMLGDGAVQLDSSRKTVTGNSAKSAAAAEVDALYSARFGPLIAAPDAADEVSIRDLASLIGQQMGCGVPVFVTRQARTLLSPSTRAP
jgi:nucleoside-diphosphate-sugar epimerase